MEGRVLVEAVRYDWGRAVCDRDIMTRKGLGGFTCPLPPKQREAVREEEGGRKEERWKVREGGRASHSKTYTRHWGTLEVSQSRAGAEIDASW